MNRDRLLSRLEEVDLWDFLVIGGGATGLGVALEAATRGYQTLLVEQSDFCKGTSCKSTKLIHGGVRYLRQGNLRLVMQALRERESLLKNAPEIVHPLPLVIPTYTSWQKLYYTAGLTLYDFLAGDRKLAGTRLLSAAQVRAAAPGLVSENLSGGVLFHDAQFDDARLALALVKTCSTHGGTLVNYMKVISILKSKGRAQGVLVTDQLSGVQRELRARVIVNCTGAFSDQLRHLDSDCENLISASQGSHVILDSSFLCGADCGLLIPNTTDGRVLFAIPWMNRVLAGTTDVSVQKIELEPRPTVEEIEFILTHLRHYLVKKPDFPDLLSVFAGIRPLVNSMESGSTAGLSRDHQVIVSSTGMVSIIGGKWTTYRKMAEDGVNQAVTVARLKRGRKSLTRDLGLSVREESGERGDSLSRLVSEQPGLAEPLYHSTPYRLADVIRAVREEWSCTVEDVLARRTRLLILDARASMEVAPKVASLMATELGHDQAWQEEQISSFRAVASGYLPAL